MPRIPPAISQEIKDFGESEVPAYTPVASNHAPTWKEIQDICDQINNLGFKHGAIVSKANSPNYGWTEVNNWGVIIAINRNHTNLLTQYKPIRVRFVGFVDPVDCDVNDLVIIHPIDWTSIYKRIDVQVDARKKAAEQLPLHPLQNSPTNSMQGDPSYVPDWEYCD